MKILLIASHKRAKALLRFLRQNCLYTVTAVGSFDASKRFLGQNEEIVIFTSEVAGEILRGFALLKNATSAKLLYVTDFPCDNNIWPLLQLGINGYVLLDTKVLKCAIGELEARDYVFIE
ncbi:MAG: hypothetical protein PHD88_00660 [Firmicutes bacterium]|nr:hypothetical protein [Bacillota bacterium]MDD4263550.1 hypothetical protein [Bacillota bacterium]MDD4692905.1 hypothetical protein [Bacillota bacterium]